MLSTLCRLQAARIADAPDSQPGADAVAAGPQHALQRPHLQHGHQRRGDAADAVPEHHGPDFIPPTDHHCHAPPVPAAGPCSPHRPGCPHPHDAHAGVVPAGTGQTELKHHSLPASAMLL